MLHSVEAFGVSVFPVRCSVSGLPIERRPEWEEIQVSDNYRVSFCVIGEKILYSIPVGSASDKGSFGFMEHRKRILRESGLDRYRYAEIADYSLVNGSPSKEVRLYFKQTIMEETAAGKLLCIWVFNTSTIIRWYYNVGAAIYKGKLPVGAVKNYADAVKRALGAFETPAGKAAGRKVPPSSYPAQLEHYRDELLNHIRSINWETQGLPEEVCDESHPFREVFAALGILKQDMDDLNQRDRIAARQLEMRNAQLRSLTDYLIHTEEREKKKIASDLHDGLAQIIAVLISKIKLSKERNIPLNPAETQQVQRLLEQALKDMRSLSFELNPPTLECGLVPALEWLKEEFGVNDTLSLELDILLSEPDLVK